MILYIRCVAELKNPLYSSKTPSFLRRDRDHHPGRRPLGRGLVAGLHHRRHHHPRVRGSLLVPAQVAARARGKTRHELHRGTDPVYQRLPEHGAQVQTRGAAQPAPDGQRYRHGHVSVFVQICISRNEECMAPVSLFSLGTFVWIKWWGEIWDFRSKFNFSPWTEFNAATLQLHNQVLSCVSTCTGVNRLICCGSVSNLYGAHLDFFHKSRQAYLVPWQTCWQVSFWRSHVFIGGACRLKNWKVEASSK